MKVEQLGGATRDGRAVRGRFGTRTLLLIQGIRTVSKLSLIRSIKCRNVLSKTNLFNKYHARIRDNNRQQKHKCRYLLMCMQLAKPRIEQKVAMMIN